MDDTGMATDKNDEGEVSLPEVVDGLRKLQVNMSQPEVSTEPGQRRSLRKRRPREDFNRRCSLRPKKRNYEEMQDEEQIKEYYLDKTIKKKTNSLETIFEEREDLCQTSSQYMSAKRFKRMIQFTTEPTGSKLKKRKEKVKRLQSSQMNFKKRKFVSMNTLLNKLKGMQNDLPVHNS